jgi:ligand-binding sensor protein
MLHTSTSLAVRIGTISQAVSIIVNPVGAPLAPFLFLATATTIVNGTTRGDLCHRGGIVSVEVGKAQEHVVHAGLIAWALPVIEANRVSVLLAGDMAVIGFIVAGAIQV